MLEQITYERVLDAAKNIDNYKEQIRSILEKAKLEMTKMNTTDTLKSASAAKLKEQFDALAVKFESFYLLLTKYSAFLNNTVTTYQMADQNIANNIG